MTTRRKPHEGASISPADTETKVFPNSHIGGVLPATADEQLAGQIAMATAEDRLKAEIEAGKRAVAEAEARIHAAE